MSALPPGTNLCAVPLARNPSGAPPNFVDPPSLEHVTYGLVAAMGALTFSFVLLRLLPALKKNAGLKLDDYCCILALILNIAFSVTVAILNQKSRHAWDTPICWYNATYLKELAATSVLYGPAEFFAKASVATLYLRMFGTVRWLRCSVWCALIFIGVIFFVQTVVYAIYSFPYGNEKWDLSLGYKTKKVTNFAMVVSVINLLADLFLLIIPIPVIMGLNLSFRKRVGLSAVFLTGLFGTGVAILGLYYRVRLFYYALKGDESWQEALAEIIIVLENYVTIMVGCVPGCVSAWHNVLRDTAVVSSLRSFISSASRTSLSKQSSRHRGMSSARSIQSDEAGLTPNHDFERLEDQKKNVGITKTIKLQQWTP